MKIQFNDIANNVVNAIKTNPQIQNLQKSARDRWQQLTLRERILVAGGGVVLVLLLLYTLIWEPLSSAVYRYRQDVITNKMLLLQIQQAGPEIKSLRSQVKRSQIKDQADLLSVVERLVRKSRLQSTVSEIGLGTENTVRLRFDDVPFDELMTWLIELQQKEGIVVNTFTLEKLPEVGRVKVQLTVSAV
jgi:general secretion pathway protein M